MIPHESMTLTEFFVLLSICSLFLIAFVAIIMKKDKNYNYFKTWDEDK